MLALLIAVFTALLFSAPRDLWAIQRGQDEDRVTAGARDVPIVTRQQEPPDHSPRRDQSDPAPDAAPPQFDMLGRQAQWFASWPLPTQSRPHHSCQVCVSRARGPPPVA